MNVLGQERTTEIGEEFLHTLRDPFDFYDRTMHDKPVFKTYLEGQQRDVYVVTSYELVKQVFAANDIYSSDFHDILVHGKEPHPEADAVLAGGFKLPPLLLNIDEPAHKRYRNLVGQVFTPKQVQPLKPQLAEIMDGLIDEVIEKGECDFIREIAVPFPTVMIARIMGYDPAILDQLGKWSDAMVNRLSHAQSKEEDIYYCTQIREFQEYIRETANDRRKNPRNDLISQIVHVEQDGFRLTDDEAHCFIHEISISGHETARNSTIGGMGMLLRDPETMARLRANRDLIPRAVEEIFRLFTAVAGMWRIATQDTTLGGVPIPKGATILVRIDAANRDPREFPNPHRIDLERRNNNAHLSFGFGAHYCIGNLLARAEVVTAITKVLDRMHNLRIVEERSDLGRPQHILLRSTNALHVAYDRGPRVGHGLTW